MHIDHHHLVAIAIFTEAMVVQLPSAPPRQPSRTMTMIESQKGTKVVQLPKATDNKAKTRKFLVKFKTHMKKKRYTRLFFAAIHIAGEWARRAVEEVELRRARAVDVQHYCGYGYDSQSSDSFAELQMVFDKLARLDRTLPS